MATVASMSEGTGVSIGGILGGAFGVMGANPVVIFGISFLFGALPPQLYSYFLLTSISSPDLPFSLRSVMMGGSGLVFLLCSMLAQGGIIRASVAYANGERASFGECIAVGLAKAVPLIILSILFALGVGFGFVLLFVPGIMLFIMWSVSAPALIAEPVGIFGAFGRSRYLTKGARWKIFGMMLLLLVLLWILSAIMGVLLLSSGVSFMATGLASGHLPFWYMGLSVVSSTISTAVTSTVITGLYIALRNWKDGPQADALADIFA
ncbi:MAG TPA: hypothetical protein VF503_07090 [Sphingobium sp.]|uniref:hypothetical protein n=1 Tax=Sphingobium sp. TaxID=1912891 RepID=UPI002ED2DD5B